MCHVVEVLGRNITNKAVRPGKSNWLIYQGIQEQTNSEEKQESTNHAVN